MKILVKMARSGALCYSSHLDLLRSVQRTLRRSKLPIQYSQGFNPHPILSFAQALGVGLETAGDYFMAALTQNVPLDQFVSRFNQHAPGGLIALAAREMEAGEKSPMARVKAARYRLTAEGPAIGALHEGIQKLMDLSSYTCTVRGKNKDIRPLIHSAQCDERGAEFLVSCGNENLSHKTLLQVICALSDINGENVRVRREDLYTKNEAGAYVPLLNGSNS